MEDDESIEESICCYLEQHPDKTALELIHLVKKPEFENARVLKTIVNQHLTALLNAGKVIKLPPQPGSQKPRWRRAPSLVAATNSNTQVRRLLATEVDREAERKRYMLLLVNADNYNIPHPNILRFPGTVILFCNKDVGATQKFPGLAVKQAEWECRGATIYEMSITADRWLRAAQQRGEQWDVSVLCSSKDAKNIVYGARRCGHVARQLDDPQDIPL